MTLTDGANFIKLFIPPKREPFLKGKAPYSWPSNSYWFINANIIYFFTKTSYLNEEVNRTEPSTSVSVPCCILSMWSTFLAPIQRWVPCIDL